MIYSASLKGKRPQNEDKHSITINIDNKKKTLAPINFYSVFDGHGGKFVSQFLSETLPHFFTNKKVIYPLKKKYIIAVYNYVQTILQKKYKREALHCGSTSLVAIQCRKQNNEYIYVLNTGDSRCVLCRGNKAVNLSKDHKPNTQDERHRITKLGGKITYDGADYRVKDLSVSRAFGDLDAVPYVTHIPEIYKYRLDSSDKFFIMACDGVWDVLSSQDAVNFVISNCYDKNMNRINKDQNIAHKLGNYAIKKGSQDNITAIVGFIN